ncbi:hypothetical protein [Acutalibacter sp. 1XD8-36]|uniref:hypothetical protein n=1 Tax=Acutalibacter sp. 1XD8-36 TaxID=2320852 RepID=UPI00261D9640|nr:hypothetical protein [Acutalibacter sp. 1XD8-36]
MREMEQRALSYLGRNPVLCMDMVEAIRRGDGVVSAVRMDGVLISVPRSEAFLLAAGDTAAAGALGELIRGAVQLAVHDKKNAEQLADELGFGAVMECRAAAYLSPMPPRSRGFDLRQVKPLGAGQEDLVLESFPDEFDRDELRERISAGALHGVIRHREMQGVIGLYPEGGIGMLAVRQDLGEEAPELLSGLVAYITGWCLENCLAPFVHVPAGNEDILGIYEQAGYTVSEKSMFWLG